MLSNFSGRLDQSFITFSLHNFTHWFLRLFSKISCFLEHLKIEHIYALLTVTYIEPQKLTLNYI